MNCILVKNSYLMPRTLLSVYTKVLAFRLVTMIVKPTCGMKFVPWGYDIKGSLR